MASWIILGLISAFFLGIYDVFKKLSVNDNAVVPVLFWSNITAAIIWLPLLVYSATAKDASSLGWLYVEPISTKEHLQLFLKACIVGSSWVCSYFALKGLPVSIAGPIRATSPFWTLLGALAILGERPSWQQFMGIGVTLICFSWFSLAGRKEGIHFRRNKWVGLMILATLIGSVSGLYDKFLLGHVGFTPATVQAWFSIYMVVFLLPLYMGWQLKLWERNKFTWRWTIPAIALCLLVADFAYFIALRDPDGLISIISSLRRGSVLIVFGSGFLLMGDVNFRHKIGPLLGILAGILLIISS